MNKLTILIFLTFAISCGKRGKEKQQSIVIDDVIAVKTEAVLNANSLQTIEASGLVGSVDEARLSFKTGGIIQKIYVEEGQKVSKGQLLATLNLTEINAQVQQATEAVNKAERDLTRIKNLFADSVSTFEQVQNLSTVLSVAKQNLQIAQYNRSYSQIHAPHAGTIVKKIMNEGELAGPGSPIFFMNATGANDWVIKIGITDVDWARLKINDEAEINLSAFPDQKFKGKITNLSQAPDANSGLYQAEVKIFTQNKKLATGLFGKVSLYPTMAKQGTSISINALVEGNNNHGFVYTVAPSNIAKKHPIEIDHISNERVFLKNFPAEINKVITSGSAYLVDGSKVKVLK